MLEAGDISSVADLRKITFADLFYAIADSGDGAELAAGIVQGVERGYGAAERKREKGTREELLKLKKKLAKGRKKRVERESWLEEEWFLSDGDETIEEMLHTQYKVFLARYSRLSQERLDIETYTDLMLKTMEDEDANKLQYDRIVNKLLEERGEDRRSIVECVAHSRDVYEGVIAEVDARLDGARDLPQKKYLDALLLLPKLNDDQDMIVFFGNNFHTTFSGIDAYSGLLYAYEHLEYVGLA